METEANVRAIALSIFNRVESKLDTKQRIGQRGININTLRTMMAEAVEELVSQHKPRPSDAT